MVTTPTEIYLALVAFFGSTFSFIIYYRESGTKLEVRANRVIEEKKNIVSDRYIELVNKTIEHFKTIGTLTEELEEDFENVSYVRVRLNGFHEDLSNVVDRITYSIGFGLASILLILGYIYLISLQLDLITSLWSQIVVLAGMSIIFYLYITGGMNQIYKLRNFEKLLNEIERCHSYDRLEEMIMKTS